MRCLKEVISETNLIMKTNRLSFSLAAHNEILRAL